jgi:ABC-type multidrug transport system fused ATPase/permease subunit
VQRADRIVVLADGRVVEQGRHDDLLRAGGVYAGLYRDQVSILRGDPRGSGRPETRVIG